METMHIPADQAGILKAAEALKTGLLVGVPTETVYGLAADALNPQAVRAIFQAKGRPADNPLIVHVLNKAQAEGLAVITPLAEMLMDAFWPGPLTLVVPRQKIVPDVVTAGLDTVALRAPSHPAMRKLLLESGLAIAAPSANRSGAPSPTTAEHVMNDLNGLIPLVLDGGPCEVGLESTVADAAGSIPVVLRPGAVTPEMIAAVAGECLVAQSAMRPLHEGEAAPSPGLRHRHYAPKAPLTLVKGPQDKVAARIRALYGAEERACVLVMEGRLSAYQGLKAFSLGQDMNQAAHRLFTLLRQADGAGCSRILAEALPEEGLGLALMNRLARAADFDIQIV
ncbi:MAG: L-threonylcarbamoyladenylate synthase [Eubacteriales bacterium]|nr:L-threonylcarbamoyladenylate synthase [Eubacteriales bacterium]